MTPQSTTQRSLRSGLGVSASLHILFWTNLWSLRIHSCPTIHGPLWSCHLKPGPRSQGPLESWWGSGARQSGPATHLLTQRRRDSFEESDLSCRLTFVLTRLDLKLGWFLRNATDLFLLSGWLLTGWHLVKRYSERKSSKSRESESLWEESNAKGITPLCFEKDFLLLPSHGGRGPDWQELRFVDCSCTSGPVPGASHRPRGSTEQKETLLLQRWGNAGADAAQVPRAALGKTAEIKLESCGGSTEKCHP